MVPLSHAHRHDGAPHDARPAHQRALAAALAVTLGFLGVEVIGGLLAGSLALLADAAHMATDAAGLGLALFAMRLAARSPTAARTFGWRRAEILAALGNGVLLGVVAVQVVIEALSRISEPRAVEGGLMLGVAIAGLAANAVAAWLLRHGRHAGLNLRAAFWHVAGDALGSLGAIAAALAMLAFDWRWADPAAAIAIAALVLFSAWRLVRESLDVLMEGTPAHVEIDAYVAAIRAVPGVVDVHDLHVWTLTSGYHAASAHVDVRPAADPHAVLHQLADLSERAFGIAHTTFQLELREPLLQIQSELRHESASASSSG
ncbi:MAG: cation transporter [Proteobacteria bacterium]|nr:MAG: cation transporter [Pseudomonadota bacterium]